MLPPLHKYQINTEYEDPLFGRKKIIGYKSLYSCSNIYYLIWNYKHSKVIILPELWVNYYATFVT